MIKARRAYSIIFLLLLSIAVFSQTNLVINPSFETYTACPNGTAELYRATGWDAFNSTPDYFNPCASNVTAQTPSNGFGYQNPANGNSYGGLISYVSSGFVREIMGGQLSSPLIISQKYFVSFMVVRGNTDNFFVGKSSNKMGAKLTTVKLYSVNINNTAHYFDNNIITDTLNWTRIKGSFIADSAYQYLMLGNFFDDVNTSISNQSSGTFAYYYIDDVCLSTDSTLTANYSTKINTISIENRLNIFPNPANNLLVIENLTKNEKYEIIHIMGEIVKQGICNGNKISIDVSDLSNGLYFVMVREKKMKLLISH